jgi:hypothetical protein
LFLSFCVCFAHVFQRSTKSEPDLARHASFDTSRFGPMYTHSQTYIHTHIISNMHIFPHTHQAIRLGKASHSLRELCLEKKGKFSHPLEERSMELFRYVQSNVQHTYTHRCIDTYKGKFSHPQEERFMELFRWPMVHVQQHAYTWRHTYCMRIHTFFSWIIHVCIHEYTHTHTHTHTHTRAYMMHRRTLQSILETPAALCLTRRARLLALTQQV